MRSLLVFVLLLLVGAPTWAQTKFTLTQAQIQKIGAHPRTFSPLTFIDEDRTLVAMDEPPFTIKKKGILTRLWLIKLDGNFKQDSVKKYDLSIPNIEQAKLSPDHKSLVVASLRGARIDKLNLSDGKLTNIVSHVKGQPGFRLDPTLIFSCGSRFFGLGYLYDGEDFAGNNTMAEIDLNQSGAAAFTPGLELTSLEQAVANTTVRSFQSPNGLFFVHQVDQEVHVTRWTPTEKFQVLDKGKKYLGSWGANESMLYGMTRQDGSHDLVLANARTGQKQVLATSPKRFLNPVLGGEANAWVTLVQEGRNRYTVLAGGSQEPRKLAEGVAGCVLRVGTQGETIVMYSIKEGLAVHKL